MLICDNLWTKNSVDNKKNSVDKITLWKKERMKTILILVGKTTDKHFQAGINDYAERISHYMPFEIITVTLKEKHKANTCPNNKKTRTRIVFYYVQPCSAGSAELPLRCLGQTARYFILKNPLPFI